MKKRTLSFLLILLMLVVIPPKEVFAQDTNGWSFLDSSASYDAITAKVETYINLLGVGSGKNSKIYWNKYLFSNALMQETRNGHFSATVSLTPCVGSESKGTHSRTYMIGDQRGCTSNRMEGKGISGGISQCYGFADYMAYVVFGDLALNGSTFFKKITSFGTDFSFFPGDVIRYPTTGGGHSRFIYKVIGETVYYIECNYGGNCLISYSSMSRTALLNLNISYLYRPAISTPSANLTVTSYEATSVTQNNAIVGGYINFGNKKPTAWGIDVTTDRSNWKDKNVPLKISNAITDWSGTGKSISVNFATDAKSNPLQPNTTYYYRFWVKYSDNGYIHSDDNGVAPKSFKTKAPESTYTLSFDSSGGTNVNAINVKLDNQFTIPSAAKTGYTLKGWYSKRNDNTWHVKSKGWFTEAQISSNNYEKEIYTVGRTPTFDTSWTEGNTNASFTFYAVWEINTLSMQYNSNGGNVGANEYSFSLDNDGYILRNGNRTVGVWRYGITYEDGLINNTSFVLSRPGYVFRGWRLGEDATAVIYDQDAPLTPEQICPELKNKNMTVTFYAVWEKDTYAINYDPNGGVGAPASQTKIYGTPLTLSSTKPTRANSSAGSYTVTLNANGGNVSQMSLTAARTTSYTFKNWNTSANGSGTSYNPGDSYTTNAATMLYAQWSISTTTGAVELPTPTRDGYSFKGWTTGISAESGITGNYTPTENVTLFATWEANTYSVTYDPNGGTGVPAAQTKPHGTALTLSTNMPTRDGWYFLGWAESADAIEADYLPGGSFNKDADTTLYAVWAQPDLVLPAALTSIEEEAFAGGAFRFVKLPENAVSIRWHAFADCPNLAYIYIPAKVTEIDADAFGNATNLTIIGTSGSTAETFANAHGFTFLVG